MLYTCTLLGRNGRLGNQLFQLAGTLGRAHRSGDVMAARFPAWPYRSFFSIPDAHFSPVPEGQRTIDIGRAYMQDLAEFSTCTGIITGYLAPSETARRIMTRIHPRMGGQDIAMHVRRGDFVARPSTHPVPRASYFRRAADIVRGHRPGARIHVFSDDPSWCEENLDIPDIRVHHPSASHSKEENEIADLLAMSNCGAHILSNSTFGWWGAWLSRSPLVLYPDPWFGPNLAHLDPPKFVPADWHPLGTAPVGPCRIPGLLVEEDPAGLVVSDPSRRRVHHLNSAAAIVFEYCTGDNTEQDIGMELTSIAPGLDWTSVINELRSIGLVTN